MESSDVHWIPCKLAGYQACRYVQVGSVETVNLHLIMQGSHAVVISDARGILNRDARCKKATLSCVSVGHALLSDCIEGASKTQTVWNEPLAETSMQPILCFCT